MRSIDEAMTAFDLAIHLSWMNGTFTRAALDDAVHVSGLIHYVTPDVVATELMPLYERHQAERRRRAEQFMASIPGFVKTRIES